MTIAVDWCLLANWWVIVLASTWQVPANVFVMFKCALYTVTLSSIPKSTVFVFTLILIFKLIASASEVFAFNNGDLYILTYLKHILFYVNLSLTILE